MAYQALTYINLNGSEKSTLVVSFKKKKNSTLIDLQSARNKNQISSNYPRMITNDLRVALLTTAIAYQDTLVETDLPLNRFMKDQYYSLKRPRYVSCDHGTARVIS